MRCERQPEFEMHEEKRSRGAVTDSLYIFVIYRGAETGPFRSARQGSSRSFFSYSLFCHRFAGDGSAHAAHLRVRNRLQDDVGFRSVP